MSIDGNLVVKSRKKPTFLRVLQKMTA